MNTNAKKTEPQISVAAQNKKRRNKEALHRFIHFAPTVPRNSRIMNEEMPNQRFISRSDRNAPRTPVQFSTEPRFISKSPIGTFSILLWSAAPVKKNEMSAKPI